MDSERIYSLTSARLSLIRMLLDTGAVKFGDFTLASGAKSDYYVDIKRATLNNTVVRHISSMMAQLIDSFNKTDKPVQAVAAPALGAVCLLGAVLVRMTHYTRDLPGFIIRKEAKQHGTQSLLECGTDAKGLNVVVIEDVITSGGSAVRAVEILRKEGHNPVLVLSVVDREQGGDKAFVDLGIPFYSLVRAKQLLSEKR